MAFSSQAFQTQNANPLAPNLPEFLIIYFCHVAIPANASLASSFALGSVLTLSLWQQFSPKQEQVFIHIYKRPMSIFPDEQMFPKLEYQK